MGNWTLEDTGLTEEEYNILSLLSFEILKDEDYKEYWYQLTNAFHLIQGVFIQRALIRKTNGKYWIKSSLPYELHEKLLSIEVPKKYAELYNNLILLHERFQPLERFHPSNLDDLTRGINQIIEILNYCHDNKADFI